MNTEMHNKTRELTPEELDLVTGGLDKQTANAIVIGMESLPFFGVIATVAAGACDVAAGACDAVIAAKKAFA